VWELAPGPEAQNAREWFDMFRAATLENG
jgi:hypothetical protein